MKVKQTIPPERRFTITQFNEQFPDDDACLDWLMEKRYPGALATCSYCRVERKHHRITTKKAYACGHCGTFISPMAGTIFEKSSTSLRLWFYAMYLISATRCGVSAKQIQREMGVTYKTAWRTFKQIRSMLGQEETIGGPDKGVEVDETYYGGRRKGRSGRPMRGDKIKTPVMRMAERGGKVVALAVPDATAKTLCGSVNQFVLPSTTVCINEYPSYNTVAEGRRYRHKR